MKPCTAQIDHLVVAAASLQQGVDWCEATLGITPGPGGQHPLMGTHNRLFKISTASYPSAYCEIIAIDSGAINTRRTSAKRWFDLDSAVLQDAISRSGPRLIHFVASSANALESSAALSRLTLDRGELLAASRMTAQGLLSWKITVRPDGQRLFYGALPTLIEWGQVHPSQAMADSGVTLVSLEACHPRPQELRQAHDAIGLAGVLVNAGAPDLIATLQTPKGQVVLHSQGI